MKVESRALLSTIWKILVLVIFTSSAWSQDATKPNLIYILADDLGYGELGCYGQEKIRTPNIDRLAFEGLRFTQHYAGSAVCAPSRCVLMTGLHTGHSYIRNNSAWYRKKNPFGEGQLPLPDESLTLAKYLQKVGYATAAIGKWGLGGPGESGEPHHQGFDLFYGYLCQAHAHNYYPEHLWRNGKQVFLENPAFKAHQKLRKAPSSPDAYQKYVGNEYAPDLMIKEALRFIRSNQANSFFLYFATPIPHAALQVPQKFLEAYPVSWDAEPYLGQKGYLPHPRPRAAYAAMVSYLDHQVGQILNLLEELNLSEQTVVMFSSDNGPTFNGGSDSEFFESTAGLRGLKGSLYEGGLRVPLVVRWPGKTEAGTETNQLSAFQDILPTLLDIAGMEIPAGLDGRSLLPTLFGHEESQKPHAFLYWELANRQAIRDEEWKLVRTARKNGETRQELFHMKNDPNEERNLAEMETEILSKLTSLLHEARVPSTEFSSPFDRKADGMAQ